MPGYSEIIKNSQMYFYSREIILCQLRELTFTVCMFTPHPFPASNQIYIEAEAFLVSGKFGYKER